MNCEERELYDLPECYCPACQGGNASTTVMLTNVPFFREILLMNLSCADCGYRNAGTSFGGAIQSRGQRITLTATCPEGLNRQIVKSDSASLFLPALELEIPAATQRGKISTLEGILRTSADQLAAQQSERLLIGDLDNFHRCHKVIETLQRWTEQKKDITSDDGSSIFPFEVVLDDPAGNSFIENLQAPKRDPQLTHVKYIRTPEQDACLGLMPCSLSEKTPDKAGLTPHYKIHSTVEQWDPSGEVMKFPTTCPNCQCPTETNMCLTNIPHFQQVVLMCMVCSKCGYRGNDIQGNGGAVSEWGTRLTLTVTEQEDLSRDVLKSDTASISIPEIELEIGGGSLGGLYTTVEGLLTQIVDHLETIHPFGKGDSAERGDSAADRYRMFLSKMKEMIQGEHVPFRIVITDPLSNSFVGPRRGSATSNIVASETESQNKCFTQHLNQNLLLETYERTHAENEDLGLNDIKTEDY